MQTHTANGHNSHEFATHLLIEKVATDAGITDTQAQMAIESVKKYVVEKFPLLEGVVKNIFSARNSS
jgi:hypothetical protein